MTVFAKDLYTNVPLLHIFTSGYYELINYHPFQSNI